MSHIQKVLVLSNPPWPLALTIILLLFSRMFPERHRVRGYGINVLRVTEHSTQTYPLYFDRSLTIIY